MIVIIDYGTGNLGSIKNMLKKLGYDSKITCDSSEIEKSTKLILPGVGAFDYGMNQLNKTGIIQLLNKKVIEDGIPILGICLGAQLMCKSSEEGEIQGLGWIDAKVKKFPLSSNGNKYTVPHLGWDEVTFNKKSWISAQLRDEARFYFVHSYFIECKNQEDVLCSNSYSVEYHSAFERQNIIGVQFHPEKSHKFGFQLLKNFVEKY